MKLKRCCIEYCASCHNCSLYALFKNSATKRSISEHRNCEYALVNYTRNLKRDLVRIPSGVNEDNANKLLEIANVKIAKLDYKLALELCESTMNSILSRGLKSIKDKGRANRILSYYNFIINSYEYFDAEDCDFIDLYAAYLNIRFQTYHLEEKYELVVREYQNLKRMFNTESSVQRDMLIHVSSSEFLINQTKQRVNSRVTAEHLYEIVCERYESTKRLEASDYYILAKFLEHHIQENNIQIGLKYMEPFMELVLLGEVNTAKEALYKMIFHRDMYEALGKVGSDDCEKHYRLALEICEDYGISDSRSKLKKKRDEVETYCQKKYFDFSQKELMEEKIVNNYIIQGDIHVQKDIHNYTIADAKKIFEAIVSDQDNRYEKLITLLLDKIDSTQGELKNLVYYLNQDNDKKKSKSIKLKEWIGNVIKTAEGANEFYQFFIDTLPGIKEKSPEIMEMIISVLRG